MRARGDGFERPLKKQPGGPGGTRTPDLRFRKALLYPAELPGLAGRSDATGGGWRQARKDPGASGRRRLLPARIVLHPAAGPGAGRPEDEDLVPRRAETPVPGVEEAFEHPTRLQGAGIEPESRPRHDVGGGEPARQAEPDPLSWLHRSAPDGEGLALNLAGVIPHRRADPRHPHLEVDVGGRPGPQVGGGRQDGVRGAWQDQEAGDNQTGETAPGSQAAALRAARAALVASYRARVIL